MVEYYQLPLEEAHSEETKRRFDPPDCVFDVSAMSVVPCIVR